MSNLDSITPKSSLVPSATSEAFNFYKQASDFWDSYHRYRPVYPQELFDTVFRFHEEYSPNTASSVAVDYGTGPGTIIPHLLEKFEKVIGTDLNEDQINKGRTTLGAKYGDRVEMKVGAAGKCDWIPSESASLVIAAEAVHWFDVEPWLKEVANILLPGGTLAFWFYPPQCTLISCSQRAGECVRDLFYMLMKPLFLRADMSTVAKYNASKLDNISLDASLFTNEQRHKWELPSNRIYIDPEPNMKTLAGDYKSGISKDAHEISYEASKEHDTFLKHVNWTKKDLFAYMETLGFPTGAMYSDPKFQETVDDFHKELGGPESTFDVGWSLSLVLATRK